VELAAFNLAALVLIVLIISRKKHAQGKSHYVLGAIVISVVILASLPPNFEDVS